MFMNSQFLLAVVLMVHRKCCELSDLTDELTFGSDVIVTRRSGTSCTHHLMLRSGQSLLFSTFSIATCKVEHLFSTLKILLLNLGFCLLICSAHSENLRNLEIALCILRIPRLRSTVAQSRDRASVLCNHEIAQL